MMRGEAFYYRVRPGVTLHFVTSTIERRNVIYQQTACRLAINTGLKERSDYGTERIQKVGCTQCRINQKKSHLLET